VSGQQTIFTLEEGFPVIFWCCNVEGKSFFIYGRTLLHIPPLLRKEARLFFIAL